MDHVNRAISFYQWTLTFADPRVAKWPMMSSPLPTLTICAAYLIFILRVGPKLMEKRKAFEFGLFLPAYNFALVALNYYILHLVLTGSRSAGYSYICTPLTKELDNVNENKVAFGVWLYYFSKLIELFDTVTYLLTKRYRQITFLHVYHHSTMPILWWIGTKWIPGGQSFFGVMLNSFVHIIMYSYYGLACLGPSVRKFLWWKRYITILQLVQFCMAIGHTANSLYVDCPSPRWMHWALIAYASSFIVLFTNFYIQTYLGSKKQQAEKRVDSPTPPAEGSHQQPKRPSTAVRRRRVQ